MPEWKEMECLRIILYMLSGYCMSWDCLLSLLAIRRNSTSHMIETTLSGRCIAEAVFKSHGATLRYNTLPYFATHTSSQIGEEDVRLQAVMNCPNEMRYYSVACNL